MIQSSLKWHGGKGAFNGKLANWIVSLMAPHLHYVEPYAGGISVLLAKSPEGVSECVNDLNGRLANFWRVIANVNLFSDFQRVVQAVPFSEREWMESSKPPYVSWSGSIPVDDAVSFFIFCRQSLAGRMKSFAPLSKTRTRRGMNEQASAWLSAIEGLPAVHERMKRVVVLGPKPAVDVIREQDGEQALFYCDSPYYHGARSTVTEYGCYEMTHDDHVEYLDTVKMCKGRVMVSGYHCDIYDRELASWNAHEFQIANCASGAKKKAVMTEVVWCNY